MGLLDSDDSAVKNHLRYKELIKAREELDKDVAFFKEKGGDSGLVQRPAGTVLRVEREHGNLKKQFPDFAGGDEHLTYAKQVADALLKKYPKDHPWTDKIKHLAGVEGPKGMLDTDEAAIRNHIRFKELVKAREQLEKDVAYFKEKGGTSGLVQGPAATVLRVEREHGNLRKQFPDFAAGDEHLAFAKEVAKALLGKHPGHPWTDKVKHLAQ